VKRKYLSILVAFLMAIVIGFGWGSNSFAASQNQFNLDEIIVEKAPDYVFLDWNDLSNAVNYVVKYEDKVIYLGKDSEFIHKELEEGSLNEYHIAAIDKNKNVIDEAYVKAFTPIEDEEYGDIGVDAISNSATVLLDWPEVEDAEKYTIYRDGTEIATTTDSLFLDENLKDDTSYEYTVGTKVRMTEERLNEIKQEIASYLEKAEKEEAIEPEETEEFQPPEGSEEDAEDLDSIYAKLEKEPYDLVEITTPIETLPIIDEDLTLNEFIKSNNYSTMAALPTSTWIKINTMILNSNRYSSGYLKGPGISKYYFATDKRKSITATGSTRTSLTAKINWSDRSTTQTKSVGWTKRYTKNANGTYKSKDERQASANNVYFGVTKKTKSMVDINFKHKANNPYYIGSPNVEYEFRSEIYRDGTTKMRGYHTLFPSLGIFRSNGSGYKTLYTHNQGERSPWSLYQHKTINFSKKTN
jgi:hypothetical protein